MKPSHPTFNHPYKPYEIQLEFMQKLYQCIEDRCVGIFESPTGTGKSLSLICAALTWLRDDDDRALSDGCDDPDSDWLAKAERQNLRKQLLETRSELEEKLSLLRSATSDVHIKQRHVKKLKVDDQLHEDDLLLEDYESDNERASPHENLSHATKALLDQVQPLKTAVQVEQGSRIQIIFSSRTHSQLSQLVGELQKLNLHSNVESQGVERRASTSIKHIPLGSRRNMCINTKVSRLHSNTAIKERCLELQAAGRSSEQKCEFLASKASWTDDERIRDFGNQAIARVQDIEDVTRLGVRMKLCPYYASRAAVPSAEILTIPYPLLLQKGARESSGIKLRDSVVIIDEAHNLKGAIADTFSVTMYLSHLELAKTQLLGYCQHFKNKLKGKNRVYITQVIKIMKSCIQRMKQCSQSTEAEQVLSSSTLLSGTGDDLIQLQKLIRYIRESKLVFKVEGYAEVWQQQQETATLSSTKASQPRGQSNPKGVLAEFQDLLVALTNTEKEGRFYVKNDGHDATITYELLDPQAHFQEIVSEARSVILAGGTMSPMSDWSSELFPNVPKDQLREYSFGHIVDKDNIYVQPIAMTNDGKPFRFDFRNRYDPNMICELGLLIQQLCQATPDGVVVFFTSYDYLAHVTKVWRNGAAGPSLWTSISKVKEIYEEMRDSVTDELLQRYSQKVNEGSGALLLAVVGGKLSEGINFSDKLGRAVACVGLPYPNIQSIEWKEKLTLFRNRHCQTLEGKGVSKSEADSHARVATKDHLDNLVMRAINQSIGRAIRHKNDFAAIFLIDQRYNSPGIQGKLPGWLKESVRDADPNISFYEDLRRFFERRQAAFLTIQQS